MNSQRTPPTIFPAGSLVPRPSPAWGHSKEYERGNEKWEMRKWGNGKKTHCTPLRQTSDVSLLQSPKVIRKSMSTYCHSLRVHLCLMPKGIHSSQHHELCVLPAIYSTFDHLLEVCWICELFIATLFQLLQGVILRLLQLLALLWIYVYLSCTYSTSTGGNVQQLYTSILYTNIVDICRHSIQFFAIAY